MQFRLASAAAAIMTMEAFYSGGSASAGPFGPSSYDDCILDSMKGVTSDLAAKAIAQSCKAKFPPVAVASRPLTRWELEQLTAQGTRVGANTFGGTVYNGNARVTVTKIVFSLTASVNGARVTRDYASGVIVPPLSSRPFAMAIVADRFVDPAQPDMWELRSADGY